MFLTSSKKQKLLQVFQAGGKQPEQEKFLGQKAFGVPGDLKFISPGTPHAFCPNIDPFVDELFPCQKSSSSVLTLCDENMWQKYRYFSNLRL